MAKRSKQEIPCCDYCGQALPPLTPLEDLAGKLKDAVYKAQPNGNTARSPFQKLTTNEKNIWLAAAQVAREELIDVQDSIE